MTAMTRGSYQVFNEKVISHWYLQVKSRFWGYPPPPPFFRFSCIINSFHKDLMWEALVFSKEIVLVFSKDPALMDANGTLRERY